MVSAGGANQSLRARQTKRVYSAHIAYAFSRAHNLADFDNTARPTNYLRDEPAFSCTVTTIVHQLYGATMQLIAGEKVMSKGQKSNKETKKVPVMTAKEKKAAKKAKKNERGRMGQ
jgi:hypothetical protein